MQRTEVCEAAFSASQAEITALKSTIAKARPASPAAKGFDLVIYSPRGFQFDVYKDTFFFSIGHSDLVSFECATDRCYLYLKKNEYGRLIGRNTEQLKGWLSDDYSYGVVTDAEGYYTVYRRERSFRFDSDP